jgi:glycosyltransferase involved in cell wall biosynthesis
MLLAKPYAIDTRVKNEAETLTNSGYRVTVLSWDRTGKEPKENTLKGVEVVSRKLFGGSEFSKTGFAFSALVLQLFIVVWCIRRMKGRYIVHANDFNTLLAGFVLRKFRRSSVRLHYDCHELTPCAYAEWYGYSVGVVAGAIEKILLKHVDSMTTVSPPIGTYLTGVTGIPATIIYNTIRKESVPPQDRGWWREKLGMSGFLVSYVGMLRQDVALDEFVEAAHELRKRGRVGISFVVVGYGPDLERIRAKSIELGNYVKFVSKVPHEIAMGYVKASDVSYAVYRSSSFSRNATLRERTMIEGNTRVAMPWKLFEAMACGTEILLKQDTYAWRFAQRVGFGLSAGSGSKEDIVSRLDWASRRQSDLVSSRDSAQLAFETKYNWEEMSKEFGVLYDRLWSSLIHPLHIDSNRSTFASHKRTGVGV